MNSCRNNFEEWMRNHRCLSENSIRNYSGAVGGYLSELAQRLGVASGSLFDIKNPDKFQKTKTSIESCAEFVDKNRTGKAMYSNALQRYLEFLNADAK